MSLKRKKFILYLQYCCVTEKDKHDLLQ